MAAAAMIAVVATAGYMGYTAYEYATMTDQERLFKANLDALSWSENYGPGEDRKQMAIQCGIGGWNIKAGCCLGYSYCSFTECTEPLINGCEPW